MSTIEVDKVIPQSGTSVQIGENGDTITIPAGATFDASTGTLTLPDGSVSVAKLSATGTKDSTTFLRGDNSFQVVNTDLVTDTTPQLGGDLDGNGNTIDLSGNTTELRLPRGTSAQQPTPSAANKGAIRYDTDDNVVYYSTGSNWFKIASATPTLTNASGNIYVGNASTLTLTGTNFLTANLIVNFTQTSDSINSNVTVTPTSETAASVAVPAAVYNNVTAGNAVTIKVTNSDGIQSNGQNVTAIALPTGGTITSSGGYRIHTFNSSGTFGNTIASLSTEYLIVAGGGGGGAQTGGGGGAGGMRTGSSTLSVQNYTVTVGAGGAKAPAQSNPPGGSSGQDSSFNSITSIGGGGGGSYQGNTTNSDSTGKNGGSGGGGAAKDAGGAPGGSGTSGQGNDGGAGRSSNNAPYYGGGGGGAGAAGQGNTTGVHAGGNGSASSITGSSVTYAGGGGGCGEGSTTPGSGGSGGGGNGSNDVISGQNGTDNLGGGGGGSRDFGGTGGGAGNGGSGVVIIRYQL